MTRANVVPPVFLLVLLVLSSCTTTRVQMPSLLPSTGSHNENRYLAALQGGIVGRSGMQMADNDRQRALEAEYKALEAAPGGQPVTWSGTGISGEVVAAAPYQVGSQNCRQYSHTLTFDAKQSKVRGAACRNGDGTWSLLN